MRRNIKQLSVWCSGSSESPSSHRSRGHRGETSVCTPSSFALTPRFLGPFDGLRALGSPSSSHVDCQCARTTIDESGCAITARPVRRALGNGSCRCFTRARRRHGYDTRGHGNGARCSPPLCCARGSHRFALAAHACGGHRASALSLVICGLRPGQCHQNECDSASGPRRARCCARSIRPRPGHCRVSGHDDVDRARRRCRAHHCALTPRRAGRTRPRQLLLACLGTFATQVDNHRRDPRTTTTVESAGRATTSIRARLRDFTPRSANVSLTHLRAPLPSAARQRAWRDSTLPTSE